MGDANSSVCRLATLQNRNRKREIRHFPGTAGRGIRRFGRNVAESLQRAAVFERICHVQSVKISVEQTSSARRSQDTGGNTVAITSFSSDQARAIGAQLGIDWDTSPFPVEQFRRGMDVELEHGSRDPETDVTGNDPVMTGKIALAHLKEFADYYIRLDQMEAEAEANLESLVNSQA